MSRLLSLAAFLSAGRFAVVPQSARQTTALTRNETFEFSVRTFSRALARPDWARGLRLHQPDRGADDLAHVARLEVRGDALELVVGQGFFVFGTHGIDPFNCAARSARRRVGARGRCGLGRLLGVFRSFFSAASRLASSLALLSSAALAILARSSSDSRW